MRYALGRCLAPCAGKCTEAEYRDRVADVMMLLQGHGMELVEKLRARMDRAAFGFTVWRRPRVSEIRLELYGESAVNAIIFRIFPLARRNYWQTLNEMQKIFNLDVLPWRIDGFDISHTAGNQTVGVVVVLSRGILMCLFIAVLILRL